MPTSNLHVAPDLIHLVWQVREEARTIVDVGAGYGKYAGLLREYVWGREGNFEHVTAIEAHAGYVTPERYAQYDEVIIGDCLDPEIQWSRWDLVFMADVVEHLPKEEALALFDRIPGYIVVSTPSDFFENWEAGHAETERHLSHWGELDFPFPAWVQMPNDIGAIVARRYPK